MPHAPEVGHDPGLRSARATRIEPLPPVVVRKGRAPWGVIVGMLLLVGVSASGLLWHRATLRTRLGDDALARAWVGERGAVEQAQLTVLALVVVNAVLLVGAGRRVGWILLPAALVVVIREADWLLEAWIGRHAHRPVMVVLLACTGWAAWRQHTVVRAASDVLRGAFAGLLAAAVLVLIAAQVLGHPQEWTQLAREGDAARVAKRYVEEGLEGLAYLLALGATTMLWFTPRTRSALASAA